MSAPTPKEIIELSKERGYLAKQLYVIFTTPANSMASVMEHLQRHLDLSGICSSGGASNARKATIAAQPPRFG